jgi:hypothetical protein
MSASRHSASIVGGLIQVVPNPIPTHSRLSGTMLRLLCAKLKAVKSVVGTRLSVRISVPSASQVPGWSRTGSMHLVLTYLGIGSLCSMPRKIMVSMENLLRLRLGLSLLKTTVNRAKTQMTLITTLNFVKQNRLNSTNARILMGLRSQL